MKVVILAGGKGTRLKPYTTSFPKPLMPVGDKPILEILIRQLASYDQKDIILAVGHLAELVMSFIGAGSQYGVKIEYSREEKPLGTIGPLSLFTEELNETFLIINGDTLTDINYSKFIQSHKDRNCIVTIAASRRETELNYGILHLNSDLYIEKYEEKPQIGYHVGTGICIFEPEVLQYIKRGKHLDLPDLINKLIADGKEINSYVHKGYWYDIGRPEDYAAACEFVEGND